MYKVLDNSLYIKDRKRYKKISECVTSFNAIYNKNNIIQDDIFNVLQNTQSLERTVLNTSAFFYFKGENYHEEQDKICKRRHFKRNERHC